MNVMLSAASMNFKRVMNLWKQGLKFFIENICLLLACYFRSLFTKKFKPAF